MSANHRHVDRNTSMFVYPLVPAIGFDWAEGNVQIYQLALLEQRLQTHEKFLKGVCFCQFDDGSHNKLGGVCGRDDHEVRSSRRADWGLV